MALEEEFGTEIPDEGRKNPDGWRCRRASRTHRAKGCLIFRTRLGHAAQLPVLLWRTSQRQRVVVTGIGVVSQQPGHRCFWQNITAGQRPHHRLRHRGLRLHHRRRGEGVRRRRGVSPKEVRRTDRFAQFIHAGWQALNDSGLDLQQANRERVGAMIGSGIGGLATLETQHKTLLDRGPGRMSPFFIPMMILNMASGMFSLYQGLRGPNVATCSACATANRAIGEAWRTLVMGEADVMFAGGTEAAVLPTAMGFAAMKRSAPATTIPGTLPAV